MIKRDDVCNSKKCLVTEIRIGDWRREFLFSNLYRSPTQTHDEFVL